MNTCGFTCGHRVTIYRRIRAGIFPEQHEGRGHKVGWLRSDIEAWLQRAPPPGSWLVRAGLPRTRGGATNQATPAAMRQARGYLKQIQDLPGNGAAA
jgi:predicted DNA-binding transcriptional regulator AlpA